MNRLELIVPPTVLARLVRLARKRNVSISDLIVQAIVKLLEEYEQEEKGG